MSARGSVPPTHPAAALMSRAHRAARAGAVAAISAGLLVASSACAGAPQTYTLASRTAPGGSYIAEVRLARCGSGWCETLWAGPVDRAPLLATLPSGVERCDEIAWSPDGTRVGFLISGHQLRLYDARTQAPAGQLDLVPADGPPTTRIARGVTFSENGKAVTFDDCPRERSGCRPGIVAMR